MRVRFENHVDLCIRITHRDESELLIVTTAQGSVYTVKAPSSAVANESYNHVLETGYLDVSSFDYSN